MDVSVWTSAVALGMGRISVWEYDSIWRFVFWFLCVLGLNSVCGVSGFEMLFLKSFLGLTLTFLWGVYLQ